MDPAAKAEQRPAQPHGRSPPEGIFWNEELTEKGNWQWDATPGVDNGKGECGGNEGTH